MAHTGKLQGMEWKIWVFQPTLLLDNTGWNWLNGQMSEEILPRLNASNRAHYEIRARVFKALAHPTRLFIVDQLSSGELCVCRINEMIDADMSTISKHLSVLRNAGILSSEKRGANVFYRLRISPGGSLFACMEDAAKTLAESLQA